MRIAVVVPSGDLIHADVVGSLLQIFGRTSMAGHEVAFINPRSSAVQRGRNMGVRAALKMKADLVYWQDSDVVAPADTILRLIGHNKPVVGCSYRRRRPPYTETAETHLGEPVDLNNNKVIGKINRLPGGCILVKASVYRTLRAPWYHMPWDIDAQEIIGEDEFFCDKCRGVDIQPWIDYSLSRELGHIGAVAIRHGTNVDA